MITIRNQQRTVPVDKERLRQDLAAILQILRYDGYAISLVAVSNTKIREYNRTYRDKDKATDILSFPFYPELKAGERIKPRFEEEKELGDLIIAPVYIRDAAQQQQKDYNEYLQMLLVHGVCHLLGYDHIEDHDWRRMRAKEAAILKKLRAL